MDLSLRRSNRFGTERSRRLRGGESLTSGGGWAIEGKNRTLLTTGGCGTLDKSWRTDRWLWIYFYAGDAEDFAFVGLLDEGDDAEVFGVGVGLQFDGYVLQEGLTFVELAEFA